MLVGRPNVGKSTLFNRITGSRRAIVTAIAGTTRDVNRAACRVAGTLRFTLVDTGGMFGASDDPLHELVVRARPKRAVETADLVVFVVDGREGLVPGDEEIAAQPPLGRRRRSSSRSTRPTTAARGAARSSSTSSASSRSSRSPRSTARASATCSTRSSQRLPGPARDGAGAEPRRNRGRHRRPAERRQVVAAQSVAAGGALDRQRHAGHDAGHRRCAS